VDQLRLCCPADRPTTTPSGTIGGTDPLIGFKGPMEESGFQQRPRLLQVDVPHYRWRPFALVDLEIDERSFV